MAAPCCVPQFLVIPGHARTPGSSAQRVLARLADEHGVTAISYSTVRDYVARRPARALRGFKTPVPRALLSGPLTGHTPSGSANAPRLLSGLLPPRPASPRQGCPQLPAGRFDGPAVKISHLDPVAIRVIADLSWERGQFGARSARPEGRLRWAGLNPRHGGRLRRSWPRALHLSLTFSRWRCLNCCQPLRTLLRSTARVRNCRTGRRSSRRCARVASSWSATAG